jgi:hypothetical protein
MSIDMALGRWGRWRRFSNLRTGVLLARAIGGQARGWNLRKSLIFMFIAVISNVLCAPADASLCFRIGSFVP